MQDYKKLGDIGVEKLRYTTEHAIRIQQDLLKEILWKNRNTDIGEDWGFSDMQTWEDFRRGIPVTNYDFYESYIHRMIKGEKNVLTANDPVYYCISSGSTGIPKYIPLCEEDIWTHYWYAYCAVFGMLNQHFSNLSMEQIHGHIFQTGEFAMTVMPDSHIMNGIRSGSVYQWMEQKKGFDAQSYCAPKEVLFPKNLDDIIYVKVRFALRDRDLTCIHGVFVNRMVGLFRYIEQHWEQLLWDIEKGTVGDWVVLEDSWKRFIKEHIPADPMRAKELRVLDQSTLSHGFVKKIWKNTKYVLAIAGSSFQSQMDQFHTYTMGLDVHYFAYAASEGIFGVANGVNCPNEYILLPKSGIFEFYQEEKNEILRMEDVKQGERYHLIFTNQSGFYRYDMEDVIEVAGFYGQAPVIRYCYRRNLLVNLADEKTNTEHIAFAVKWFEQKTGYKMAEYCVTEDEEADVPRYLFYMEIEDLPLEQIEITYVEKWMDQALCEANYSYQDSRQREEIGPVKVYVLSSGAFRRYERYCAKKGYRMGQHKALKILDTKEKKDFFKKESMC